MGCYSHHRPSDLHPRDINFIIFPFGGGEIFLVLLDREWDYKLSQQRTEPSS